MKKGFILVDIPDADCRKCKMYGDYNVCGVAHRYIDPVVGKKPDWCPIREFPKRKKEQDEQEYLFGKIGKAFESGWNACLNDMDNKNNR